VKKCAEMVRQAYPEFEPVFGGHGLHQGHRAPRDHTISFRLRDHAGKYHSNEVWILPHYLAGLTRGQVRWLVADSNGQIERKRKQKQRKRRR
jgi:hypothetical protein